HESGNVLVFHRDLGSADDRRRPDGDDLPAERVLTSRFAARAGPQPQQRRGKDSGGNDERQSWLAVHDPTVMRAARILLRTHRWWGLAAARRRVSRDPEAARSVRSK